MNYYDYDKDSLSKWETLCKFLNKNHGTESELEVRLEDCLYFILGWADKNIRRQHSVQMGHEHKKRTDIMLYDDANKPIFVIEVKKQGWNIKEHEVGQLRSYMRLESVEFGLLVSDKLSLYYDPQERGSKQLKRILNLSFKDTKNTDGAMLVKYISHSSFSYEEYKSYYIDYLTKKERIEKEHGIIDNIANYRKDDTSKDEAIRQLIKLYSQWLKNNEREMKYIQNLGEKKEWILENVINYNLTELSDDDFVRRIEDLKKHIPNIGRFVNMHLKNRDRILEIRIPFEKAISHLSNMDKEKRYNALSEFTTGEYSVKYLKEAFWSQLICARFPDVPLYNQKTQGFFDAIGVYIGDSYDEKLKNISMFYERFSNNEMSLDKLSHLEHFAVAKKAKNEAGINFIRENFNNYNNCVK